MKLLSFLTRELACLSDLQPTRRNAPLNTLSVSSLNQRLSNLVNAPAIDKESVLAVAHVLRRRQRPPTTGFLQAFASRNTQPKPSVSPSGISRSAWQRHRRCGNISQFLPLRARQSDVVLHFELDDNALWHRAIMASPTIR